MHLRSKTLVFPTPPGATSAYEYSYYGTATGLDKVRLRYLDVADDIFDGGTISFSTDNGVSWSGTRPHGDAVRTEQGTLRTFDGLGFLDPVNGLLVNLYLEGLFTGLNSLEGMSQYYLKYRVSRDGGRTFLVDERVIQRDPSGKPGTYSAAHPIESVWIGRNCMCIPANQSMVRAAQGHLVVAAMESALDEQGELSNPGGGFTWLEERILLGHWRGDGSGHLDWECGPRLALSPQQSTRGLDESAMTRLPDDRLLLVMRASNGGAHDQDFRIPSYKWFSISEDGGYSWSDPRPWTYDDGERFYSPASMSVIVRHSNGNYYWFGNICPENPRANHPRYPLVCVQIDPQSCLLRRETLFVVDTRKPGEPELLQYSNFNVHEDRVTGELIVCMPRFMPAGDSWTGDTYLYRIAV